MKQLRNIVILLMLVIIFILNSISLTNTDQAPKIKCHDCSFHTKKGPCQKTLHGWTTCNGVCIIEVIEAGHIVLQGCAELADKELLGCSTNLDDPTVLEDEKKCICNKKFCNEGYETARDNKENASSLLASTSLILSSLYLCFLV